MRQQKKSACALMTGLVDEWREGGRGSVEQCADDLEMLIDGISAMFDAADDAIDEALPAGVIVEDFDSYNQATERIRAERLRTAEQVRERIKGLEKEKQETENERDRLENERDRLRDSFDADELVSRVQDGYHAFATDIGWYYPDGELLPLWGRLDDKTRHAFEAFARELKS